MPGGLLPRWELNFPRGCVVVVRKMTMHRDLTSAPFNDKCALNCPLAVHVRVIGVPKSAAAGATARGACLGGLLVAPRDLKYFARMKRGSIFFEAFFFACLSLSTIVSLIDQIDKLRQPHTPGWSPVRVGA